MLIVCVKIFYSPPLMFHVEQFNILFVMFHVEHPTQTEFCVKHFSFALEIYLIYGIMEVRN